MDQTIQIINNTYMKKRNKTLHRLHQVVPMILIDLINKNCFYNYKYKNLKLLNY